MGEVCTLLNALLVCLCVLAGKNVSEMIYFVSGGT